VGGGRGTDGRRVGGRGTGRGILGERPGVMVGWLGLMWSIGVESEWSGREWSW